MPAYAAGESAFHLVPALAELKPCRFVIESVREDLELKRQIYDELERAVPARR